MKGCMKLKVIDAYHWKSINEVAVNGIKWTSVVISWSADRSKIDGLHHKKRQKSATVNDLTGSAFKNSRKMGLKLCGCIK